MALSSTKDTCNACHTKLAYHGGHRLDPRFCVTCHTDQRRFGSTDATSTGTTWTSATDSIQGMSEYNFPTLIHKIHMGEHLTMQGYDIAVDPVSTAIPQNANPLPINNIRYPQDQRNCNTCHTAANAATPQGDNWMNVPNRASCGACHDDIVWASGANHPGGPQIDDQQCSVCHNANAIQLAHVPVVPPDPSNKWNTGGTNPYTNASYVAANHSNLPPGANTVAWDLQSVTLTAAGNPQYVFRILVNGAPVTFQDPKANTEMLPNYVGSPSLLIACALPQDGIAAPADYNFEKTVYLKNLWNGTGGGTLTGPDANGYYTATLTGFVIPTTASMITGGMGYTYGYYSQPLTQTDVPPTVVNGVTYADYTYNATTHQGGLSVPAPNVHLLATNLPAGYATQSARRAIINPNACNACHKAMGVFEDAAFHAGERNDPTTCAFCHNSNGTANGWPYNIKDMIHMLHGASVRANLDTWNNTDYFATTYPAILNNCEACHVPGSYDFSGSANAAAAQSQSLLWTTVASGTPSGIVLTDPTAYDPTQTYTSPFIVSGTNYGSGFAATNAGVTTEAAGTTLVNSPIASACYACHDSAIAKDHMTQNGGDLDVPRSTAFANVEQCLICHGPGKVADIKAVHMNF